MLNWLIQPVLQFLWSKLIEFVAIILQARENHKEAEAQAKQDTAKIEKIKPDSSAEETEDAILDASKHL